MGRRAFIRLPGRAKSSDVAKHERDSADGLVARIRRLLDHRDQVAEDMTVVVIKRDGRV